MKNLATAFIVGSPENCARGLMDISQDLNFSVVLNFKNQAMAEQQSKRTPICFFLFALDCTETNIPVMTALIRNSRNRQIKYAPMIGFIEAANSKMIGMCLKLGFDDIVLPPFKKSTLSPRLELQIGKPRIYYETADYFGPDRRKQVGAGLGNVRISKRKQNGAHTKITFCRNLKTGIQIQKKELVEHSTLQESQNAIVI
ncbi:MAG: hypothetical protein L3J21_10015 [Devosiaceae bacterium]|nr:hypothetical protein [Devosiaceae bacterium]